MKKTQRIGWQKYEDVLESRINSPLVDVLFNSITQKLELETEENEDKELYYEIEQASETKEDPLLINFGGDLSNEITLADSFDCWLGHTNFNLTEEIKEGLNKVDGIEVLKICSRYRFFVGIGKMFEFSDVRERIEKDILNQGEKIE